MLIEKEINHYIDSLPQAKSQEMHEIHNLILEINPNIQLWFLDGKNEQGKVVSNPNIGYGKTVLHYANGTSREFYKVGLSANTTGISIYIMGIEDKKHLSNTYAKILGKASISGYCIKFKKLSDINLSVLKELVVESFVN